MKIKRKYPAGAELINNGVDFRVFAKQHKKVALVLKKTEGPDLEIPMKKDKEGYFSVFVKDAKAGARYFFRIGNSKELVKDPASRFQPFGPDGPSVIVDPSYPWSDKNWKGCKMKGLGRLLATYKEGGLI